jgi:hypothetical protein
VCLFHSPLQAYFLTIHGNGEVPILGKLPLVQIVVEEEGQSYGMQTVQAIESLHV